MGMRTKRFGNLKPEQLASLRETFPHGSTAYLMACPGTFRTHLAVVGICKDGHVRNLSHLVAGIVDWRFNERFRALTIPSHPVPSHIETGTLLVLFLRDALWQDDETVTIFPRYL